MMWRRLDNPGHEWARVSGSGATRVLRGTAVFREDGVPGRLDYRIVCSPRWETVSAVILGWAGQAKVDLRIARTETREWSLDGAPVPGVKGCQDIDLAFSPSTNLLPLRRLGLQVGQEAEVRAAWLTFPDLGLHPLVQWFRREAPDRYAYRSDNGFSTMLKVDASGFVVDYPPLWTQES